jgi:MbtH protein
MSSPFDKEDGRFVVLTNEEGQHSLWPAFMDIPSGWTTACPANGRQACLDYINGNWTDMRPKGLAKDMESDFERSKS